LLVHNDATWLIEEARQSTIGKNWPNSCSAPRASALLAEPGARAMDEHWGLRRRETCTFALPGASDREPIGRRCARKSSGAVTTSARSSSTANGKGSHVDVPFSGQLPKPAYALLVRAPQQLSRLASHCLMRTPIKILKMIISRAPNLLPFSPLGVPSEPECEISAAEGRS
jgi:hypothetical protein